MFDFEDDEDEYVGDYMPGMPDRESADSFALWIQGMLEDPLGEEKADEPDAAS